MIAAKPPVTENLLFVDGISRSGKKLTCKIVSHLQRVEYFQYASVIENTAYLRFLGHMGLEEAARFLQVYVDEIIYNRAIGRNLNTRLGDETCILKDTEPEVYFNRSKAPDGMAAMDRFNAEDRIAFFYTHSVLGFNDLMFQAFPYLKIIHVTRHPIDIAEDWLRRGWGDRWGIDPLLFSITLETDTGPVPWHAADWAELYQNMTPAERCAETIVRHQARDRESLKTLKAPRQDRVFQFAFETLISDPDPVVDGLARFVGTEPHSGMPALLSAENCPPPVYKDRRGENLKKLESQCSDEVIGRLLDASRIYEAEWDLEPATA